MENQDLIIDSLKEAIARDNKEAIVQFEKIVTKEVIDSLKKEYQDSLKKKEPKVEYKQEFEDSYEDSYESVDTDSLDVPHDLVSLPSKGLLYKKVKSKIPVAYLTASDEDLITSPLLYQEGKILDVLLKKKILDKSIKPEELCQGDRDAIIVWLRATGYGYDFPISVKDPITQQDFDSIVDLGKLKMKEFNLKPNKNGLFEFTLPISGKLIEFRFLNHKDEVDYNKMLQKTNGKVKKSILESTSLILKELILNEDGGESNVVEALNTIQEYIDKIPSNESVGNAKAITYRLERCIVSVDGNYDRKLIHDFVINMRSQDAFKLRKYITENTPAIDFSIDVQRPKSLGGGTNDTFQSVLELDQNIFLNV